MTGFNDDRELHQGTPSGYVKSGIQEIERRMQLRTPDVNSDRQAANDVPPKDNDDNDATPKDSNALVLHSPIPILPNSNIKQFESDILKKQAEYAARISDLEGRLATFHTRLAEECAERGREHAFTVEEYVDGPLEQVVMRSLDRIDTDFIRPIMDPKRAAPMTAASSSGRSTPITDNSGEKQSASADETEVILKEDTNDNNSTADNSKSKPLPNLVSIERKTYALESQMNHQQHVTLFDSRRQNFDAIDKTCRTTLQPALALEITKADKREVGMVRRFEARSGENARLLSEMTSGRASSLGYLESEVDEWGVCDAKTAEKDLEEIERLKELVIEEREERIREDEAVVEKIKQTKKHLEEAIFFAS